MQNQTPARGPGSSEDTVIVREVTDLDALDPTTSGAHRRETFAENRVLGTSQYGETIFTHPRYEITMMRR